MAKKKREPKISLNPLSIARMIMDQVKVEMVQRGMCSPEEFDKARKESEVMCDGKNDSGNPDRNEILQ